MVPRHALFSLCAIILMAFCASVKGQNTVLSVSDATNIRRDRVVVIVGRQQILVPILHRTPATLKRDLIRDRLRQRGASVVDDGPNGRSLMMLNLHPQAPVTLNLGGTGEEADRLVGPNPQAAVLEFRGSFDPLSSAGQPAVFTAGIITDVGELATQVTAQELGFQTDGPIVCQALFQRLAPRAPQFGAQINFAGDRLEILFDPALTANRGGILFGTTSPTPGCNGTLGTTAPPSDKKKHCLVVTAPVDSRVSIEYLAPTGDWMPLRSKSFTKNDKEWKVCDLVAGKKYRIIGRKQGDKNEGNWKEFTFQPDAGSDDMKIDVEIKMK